ncbi:DNA-binding PucR family transcriptional regulator [Microbacterium sp. AG1240]|uniref:helix-turn-helix domain-containing protein n=1 Tax=Microbacterium sp. AG1240 TaxID=2183992 RepID=UPI000EB1E38D|nr:helix-turn-helix domain-containing protein [Microbacterium sp. AG1240]RKT31560.1 DNA-binding PucR family transcriptional regulator [Microbacterium sp. AG1240]
MTTPTSGVSLNKVLSELGSTVVELAIGRVDPSVMVSTVSIFDPLDHSLITPGSLVLGVGVAGDESILDLIRHLTDRNAAAVVLREPISVDRNAAAQLEETGVPVIGLVRGVPWNQVAAAATLTISRSTLELSRPTEAHLIGDAADLRSLANSVAALLDAAITIEDVNSRIVAFSSGDHPADRSRRAAVLGQQVPDSSKQRLRSAGIFHRIYAEPLPIFVEAGDIYERGRAVIRVTAGESLLGSIWAVVDAPLDGHQQRVLVEASRLVAIQMLRERVEADASQRQRRRQLAALLAGGDSARHAAHELGLHSKKYAVCAVTSVDSVNEDPADVVRMDRISRTFELHLLTFHPHSVAGVIGKVVYGVLPVDEKHASERAYLSSVGGDFVTQRATRLPVRLGIGELVDDIAELNRSRSDADRVLRVIAKRERGAYRIDEVRHDVILAEMKERWIDEHRTVSDAVTQLEEWDDRHGTQLVATLEMYLEKFGDVRTGAAELIVHPNTFRLRLRRIQELLGADLEDPDQRFSLMLQLRLRRL